LICIEDIDFENMKFKSGASGRSTRLQTLSCSGKYVASAPLQTGESHFDIAVDATLRTAILRQAQWSQRPLDSFSVTSEDLRKKIFRRPCKTLIILVVDASDSMGKGTYARMKAAKGAALALLAKAGKKKIRLGVIAFRKDTADVILQPTTSLKRAQECLKNLPTGGATPFSDGLMKAWQLIQSERLKDPNIKPVLIMISDGEANVPYDKKRGLLEVMDELFFIAHRISREPIYTIAIDTKPHYEKSKDMRMIAKALKADYHHINSLKAGRVLDVLSKRA
jgi:magnesium chelatase subunit D